MNYTVNPVTLSPTERVLNLVENLLRQLGAERNDEFGAVPQVTLVADNVQSGQRLDIIERHLL